MRIIIIISLIFITRNVQAQYNQQDVLLGQNGQNLVENLVLDFKPAIILGYDDARDTLFSKIYAFQDSVSCVYTGYHLYLNPLVDPSTHLYQGGIANGINTEHTYPQSKGAGLGNARSDMHHLYPVRAGVNSARSNYPYAEINDAETDVWLWKKLEEASPSQNINWYSELDQQNLVFEPRESHKGNAARAIFYFYTMYKTEADAADPSFFAQQVSTLCDWHLLDPVDSLEWERTFKIAAYQENKPNPFVLDCTLPYRTYCPHLPANSCFTSTSTLENMGVLLYEPFPNPVQESITISYELDQATSIQLEVFDVLGVQLESYHIAPNTGQQQLELDCSQWGAGTYFYRLTFKQGAQYATQTKLFNVY